MAFIRVRKTDTELDGKVLEANLDGTSAVIRIKGERQYLDAGEFDTEFVVPATLDKAHNGKTHQEVYRGATRALKIVTQLGTLLIVSILIYSIYFAEEKPDRMQVWIFWALAVLIAVVPMVALSFQCPECKGWWALEKVEKTAMGTRKGTVDEIERTTHKDRFGNVIATSERPVTSVVDVPHFQVKQCCRYCGTLRYSVTTKAGD